ncbi:MAG: DUF945 family protein [Pseudomonadota bacterium]
MTWSLPAVEKTFPGDRTVLLRFPGADGTLRFDADWSQWVLKARLLPLEVEEQGGGGRLTLGPLTVSSDVTQSPEGLFLGTLQMHLEHLALSTPDGEKLEGSGIRFQTDSHLQAGLIDLRLASQLEQFTLDGRSYAPAELDLRLNHLSAQALATLNQLGRSIGHGSEGAIGLVITAASDLLQANPVLALERLHLTTPEGTLEGRFNLRGQGLALAHLMNTQTLLDHLAGQAHVRASEKLVHWVLTQQMRHELASQPPQAAPPPEAAPTDRETAVTPSDATPKPMREDRLELAVAARLGAALASHFVVRQADDLVLAAELTQGQLTLNGQVLSLTAGLPARP